jgi:signal transduction histidine kinase
MLRRAYQGDLARLILRCRRASIVAVMLLGYAYFRLAGESAALVSMGLISFAAVAQFAPAIIGGLFWKGGTRAGVLTGLLGGFVVWVYTLLLPNFSATGWLSRDLLNEGPFGIALLRPENLLGIEGMDSISHGMFWTMLVNVGAFVMVSLLGKQSPRDQAQAVMFVDALSNPRNPGLWRSRISIKALHDVLQRSLGPRVTEKSFEGIDNLSTKNAPPELVSHVETVLAGAVGTASAPMILNSVAGEEQLGAEEVMEMLDEAPQIAALEERHRLARELHDSVSQSLFSMTLHTRAVELALNKQGGDPGGLVVRGISELRALTQDALIEMRASLFQLRPDALREDGLTEAVRKQSAAISSREGVIISVSAPDYRLALGQQSEAELFRVVQEAVHNAIKHARPFRIEIIFEEIDDKVLIEVAGDGIGFDPAAISDSGGGGIGLTGMRERVEKIGGIL